ncbi:MAG: metallophosphoesterase family protein [Acidimicrobiia bacterium]|nr:metallophosphoesterase family protein [Acidimicrobiia bacterium]
METFTVEPTAVQLTWVGLGRGPLAISVGGERHMVDSDGGPGGLVVGGLSPAAAHRIHVDGPGIPDRRRSFTVRTPAPPPGPELFRFATVSDVHLGADHFGLTKRMRERGQVAEPHPERCGQAAIAEAMGWGAEMLVVKGDLVDAGSAEQWDDADRLLATAGVPVSMVPGNHEVRRDRPTAGPLLLPLSGAEITMGVRCHDLPGLRLVTVNSTVDGHGHGAVRHIADEVATLAAEADGPVFVAMHHYAQRFEVPWFWPPGIPGREARQFLSTVARANPRALVTSGHTHRNRIRRHGPVVVTEVGSTKDFPGVWAGYVVHEGGIVQTVRRTLAPEAMRWTEYTRRAVGGIWGRWSIGSLDDRCISHTWPR